MQYKEIKKYTNSSISTEYISINKLEKYGYIKYYNEVLHVYLENTNVIDGVYPWCNSVKKF